MSAAELDRGARRGRFVERACLAALIVLAFVLRTRHIESFFVSPDEGSYLNSALVQQLEPGGFHPLRWIGEDVQWVQHLVRNYTRDAVTYQHSYLHQWLARWLFRFGCGAIQSIRMSSALTGTLTVLVAWWAFAWMWPDRRRLGLLAAAVIAVAPLHVFYSRIGWGQIGFACFFLAYTVVLYRLLFVLEESDRRGMRRAGFALTALSLLAFGWHEGVAPYIAGCAGIVLAAPALSGRSVRGRSMATAVRSHRTWVWVWSSVPVGIVTIALAVFSRFAQEKWFNPRGLINLDWLDLKGQTIEDVFVTQRIDLLIGGIVIVLAIAGVAVAWRANKQMAAHLLATAGVGSVILFLFFGDAYLVRAHMPAFVGVFLFAAIGLGTCASWLAARAGHLIAGACVTGVLFLLMFTSWTTTLGSVDSLFFVQHFYARTSSTEHDYREVDLPILERLRSNLRAGESVGVFTDKAAIFRLQDVGIRAREDYLEGPPETWPTWVVGTIKGKDGFEGRPQRAAYDLVLTDTIGRWGMWRRAR